ncbi:MAG: hypothetical protein ACTHLN_09935 [Tepidisphaeraceae bacterium]
MTPDFAPPLAVAAEMVGFRRPWGIAGGWGLDLWLGRSTRVHPAVHVAVLRDHQIELRQYLQGWKFKIAAMDGRLVPWKDSRQMLMLPIHELHATGPYGQSCIFFLHESDGIDWIYRRNFDVRMNLSKWLLHAGDGIPVLHPLIGLLFKAHRRLDTDALDFRVAMDRMDADQKMWLRVAFLRNDPEHPWLDGLA